jgi:hypothetical protein
LPVAVEDQHGCFGQYAHSIYDLRFTIYEPYCENMFGGVCSLFNPGTL